MFAAESPGDQALDRARLLAERSPGDLRLGPP
jgi:hypothetical protein